MNPHFCEVLLADGSRCARSANHEVCDYRYKKWYCDMHMDLLKKLEDGERPKALAIHHVEMERYKHMLTVEP